MDHRRRLQAQVDADDVALTPRHSREDNRPLPLDRERHEPAIGAARDRRREDAPIEAALASGLLQAHGADHRQAQVALAQFDLVDAAGVAQNLAD